VFMACTAPVRGLFPPLFFLCISSSFFLFFVGKFSYAFLVLGSVCNVLSISNHLLSLGAEAAVLPSCAGPSDLLILQ
jgi:hypothetical protein